MTIEKAAEMEKLRESQKEVERESQAPEELYKRTCIACHGTGSAGPELTNIGSKLTEEEINSIIKNGQGIMLGGLVNDDEAQKLAKWLSEQK